jgi:predicted dehydrogenase
LSIVRLGILGTGIAANQLYWPELQKLRSRYRITAVCNRTRAKAEAFAKLTGAKAVCDTPEELFARDDVDAIAIALPIELQPDYVLAALKAGKHVLSEKPVAANLKQGRPFVKKASALAAKKKLIWLVAEQLAFAEHVAKAEQWLSAKAIGDVRLVTVSYMTLMTNQSAYFQTKWRQNPKFAGGFVVDGGVHMANVVRRLLGMPKEAKSITASFNPALKPIDTAVAALKFANGAVGVWRSCFSVSAQEPRLRLSGSRGDLDFWADRIALQKHGGQKREFVAKHSAFYHQFMHFHAVISGKTKLAFTPEEALLDLEFMLRIIGE